MDLLIYYFFLAPVHFISNIKMSTSVTVESVRLIVMNGRYYILEIPIMFFPLLSNILEVVDFRRGYPYTKFNMSSTLPISRNTSVLLLLIILSRHFYICIINYNIHIFLHTKKPIASPHREIFSESCKIKPKSDCIYHFPIDLERNGIQFGSRSIGKW